MTTQLSPSQHLILNHAAQTTDGKLDWFPDTIKGGARKKVIDSLLNRALIIAQGDDWLVTAEGYEALGRSRPVVAAIRTARGAMSAVAPAQTAVGQSLSEAARAAPRIRETSKQASVIQMLQRPEGATIAQVCEVTGWQAHTVRGYAEYRTMPSRIIQAC